MEMNESKAKLIIEDTDGIRWLKISNPNRRNALTRAMLTDLIAAVAPAKIKENNIKAVLLTGDDEGNCFSSGFNILDIDDAERDNGLDPISAPAQAIEKCPVPVIASINGLIMGGALELAMACDFRIAESESRLSMPPARIGLVYSGEGLLRFLRQLPLGVVKRLFLLGETMTSDYAKAHGIFDEVVPSEELTSKTLKWAEMIANNAPLAVSGMLDLLRHFSQRIPMRDEEMERVAYWRQKTIGSKDLQEGILAFKEKRAPVFHGE
jgi:enoyl-CoA hydratase/carnithine racemase